MSSSDPNGTDKATTPPTIDISPTITKDIESKEIIDIAIPQKREREVSLEPATPHPDDKETDPVRMREKDSRTPAKKNRTHLTTTEEERDADVEAAMHTDSSEIAPNVDSGAPDVQPVSGSPPHETKMRQISQGVEDINWEKNKSQLLKTPSTDTAPLVPETTEESHVSGSTTPPSKANTPSPATPSSPKLVSENSGMAKRSREEESADANPRQTKRPTPPPASPRLDGAGISESSTSKRPRDDHDKDENPRQTKRPTPPPADEQPVASGSTPAPAPAAVPALSGGFLAYASTSSPFAAVKGTSLFGNKSKNPSPWASGHASPSPKPGVNPFGSASTANPFTTSTDALTSPPSSPKPAGAQTPAKRTGFEAFANQSPFAAAIAARARSPTRSKSPVRRGTSSTPAASKAFTSYASGGAQGLFGSSGGPAAKRPRAESPSLTTGEKDEDGEKEKSPSGTPEGSEEGAREDNKTFREQLREGGKVNGHGQAGGESSVWGEPSTTSSMEEKDVPTGEEDEIPVCSVRGKLFVLNEQNQWKERGTGTIRLNVKQEDESMPRLVMRKDAVHSVLLNAPLFKGMHCSIAQDPRYIRVSAIEAGTLTHYNIRVGNSTAAESLHNAITAWTPGNVIELAQWKQERANFDRLGLGRRS